MLFLPNFKGFDFFPHGTHLPFMRFKGPCLLASIIAMALSFVLIATYGFNFGVDFKGGTIVEVQSKSGPADLAELRRSLGGLGLGEVQIQSFGAPSDVLIRVEQQTGTDARDSEVKQQQALAKILASLSDNYTQRRVEVVGPAVSSELRITGMVAVLRPACSRSFNWSSTCRSWRRC
jgi:preprotein translocase subunit SecF